MSIPTLVLEVEHLSDGETILKLFSLADLFEKHPAYKDPLPYWVPGPAHLRETATLLQEVRRAVDLGAKDREGEIPPLRAKIVQDLTFAGQFMVMYSTHHNDPIDPLGLGVKHRNYVRTPVKPPEKFTKFSAKPVGPGMLEFVVNRMPGNGGTELQVNDRDPADESAWRSMTEQYYQCRNTVAGLQSVRRYYLRARFVNSAGAGPWSDVIEIIVP